MTDESIFAAALAIPSPADRAAYLDRACAGNPALRQDVEGLLAAHAASNPLDRPARPVEYTGPYQPEASETGPTAAVGDRVGPYKLLERIGEGGMGEVWVADQLEPIKRRVALKLIKPGMDTRSVLGRFEAERQALAVMDHPNISKVLDAGTTADGRPFFVMELVKGTPITQFCDARKLTPKQRLELFIPVCLAIQHAHQKGIIHRDIKPSNVLVELYDDKAVAKVIDFGVAKAIGQQLTEKTIYTGFGALVGTPAYMAPEQATFNALDVDTRADVYALGVLLYELLAGSPPVELERLKKAAIDEVLRIVRDEEPPRPSQRLSTSQAKASIAATRQSDPAKLSQLMKGELDWIVMKALEKDRTRRYDSATALAKDVERYLTGDAVEACPPTLGYRLRKAYRRNRPAVLVVAAFLLVTWIAAGGVYIAYRRAVAAEGDARESAEVAEKERQIADTARRAAERTAASLEIDVDLAAYQDDPTLGLLRLAGTLKRLPADCQDLREFAQLAVLCEGALQAPLLPPISHDGYEVTGSTLSPDKRTQLTLGRDGTVRLWDVPSSRLIATLRWGEERLVSCGLSPDGKTAYVETADGVVRLWDAPAGTYRAQTDHRPTRYRHNVPWVATVGGESIQIAGDTMLVRQIYVTPKGGGYGTTTDGPVELYDIRSGRRIIEFNQRGLDKHSFELMENGLWVYALEVSRLTVHIFSTNNGRLLAQLSSKIQDENYRIDRLISSQNKYIIMIGDYQKKMGKNWHERIIIYNINLLNAIIEIDRIDLPAEVDHVSIKYLTENIFSINGNNMGGGYVWRYYRHGSGLIDGKAYYSDPLSIKADPSGRYIHTGGGKLLDLLSGEQVPPPRAARYHPALARFASDGRLADLIDIKTDKTLPVGLPENYFPDVGFIGRSGQPVHFGTGKWPDIDPNLLQLWAQVAVRGELGPNGEFVKWNEETWEKKRQELAAVPPPYPDFPFPGYVATDKLHWLRAEYASAAEKDKLSLATELLRRAEASGDKAEAVRWRAERAKYVREVAPLPRAVRP